MPKNWNRRFKHNREKIKTGDVFELAEVVRNLAIRESEKGLSTGEKQMYTRAKKILASELMYALDMEEDEAESHLETLIEDAHTSRNGARRLRVATTIVRRRDHSRRRQRRTPWCRPAPRRSSFLPASRCSSGALEALRRGLRPGGRGRARRASRQPPDRVAGGASRSESVRNAAGRRARGRPSPWCTTPRGRSSTRELVRALRRRELEGVDGAIAAARVTDTVKEADGRAR